MRFPKQAPLYLPIQRTPGRTGHNEQRTVREVLCSVVSSIYSTQILSRMSDEQERTSLRDELNLALQEGVQFSIGQAYHRVLDRYMELNGFVAQSGNINTGDGVCFYSLWELKCYLVDTQNLTLTPFQTCSASALYVLPIFMGGDIMVHFISAVSFLCYASTETASA